MLPLITQVINFLNIVAGREFTIWFINQIRFWYFCYEDEKLKRDLDLKYAIMLEEWKKYKEDLKPPPEN